MAISEKKRAANRRNAQKSTGPKTAEGKAASSMNAVKHGIYAASLVLPGEDPKALEALAAEVYEQYRPVGVMEKFLCRRLTMLLWRMERVARVEVMAYEFAVARAGRSMQPQLFAAAASDVTERGIVTALGRYERRLAASFKETLAQIEAAQESRTRDTARRALAGHRDEAEHEAEEPLCPVRPEQGDAWDEDEPENKIRVNEATDGGTMRVAAGFGRPAGERDPHDCECSGEPVSGDGGSWY